MFIYHTQSDSSDFHYKVTHSHQSNLIGGQITSYTLFNFQFPTGCDWVTHHRASNKFNLIFIYTGRHKHAYLQTFTQQTFIILVLLGLRIGSRINNGIYSIKEAYLFLRLVQLRNIRKGEIQRGSNLELMSLDLFQYKAALKRLWTCTMPSCC